MILDDAQRSHLHTILDDPAIDEERRRNARIILAYDGGADTRDIAGEVGLSGSRTRYWRSVFAKYGMEMFADGFAPKVTRHPSSRRSEGPAFELTDKQRLELQRLMELREDEQQHKRIALLLAYADGRETDDIARDIGLSPSRTRYWRKTFERRGLAMFDTATDGGETTPAQERTILPGIRPDDSFADAGRKVLRMYFEEMLRMEEHPEMDSDLEVVHKMRVATRRIRSAFEIFDGAFDVKVTGKFGKPLKKLARALGNVRDLDVLLENMRSYAGALSPDDAGSFAPLLRAWEEERLLHFNMLRTHLDSPDYHRFRESFRGFVATPGSAAKDDTAVVPGVPLHIAQIAPRLVLRRYTNLLAFDLHIDTASIDLLHRLRIECKKLRYTMECFAELLGPGGRKAIRQVVYLQDYLGELQDGQAASDMITDFVSGLDARQSARPLHERLNPAPLLNYLASRESHKHALLLGTSEAWAAFRAPGTHKRILRCMLP